MPHVRVAARAVTPAVILFLLVSSVTAFARTSFTSAFGFPGQEAEQVLTEAAQNMDADGFWNLVAGVTQTGVAKVPRQKPTTPETRPGGTLVSDSFDSAWQAEHVPLCKARPHFGPATKTPPIR
jgi:hypothetical protein